MTLIRRNLVFTFLKICLFAHMYLLRNLLLINPCVNVLNEIGSLNFFVGDPQNGPAATALK